MFAKLDLKLARADVLLPRVVEQRAGNSELL